MIKSFLIDGCYVPATAIACIKPPDMKNSNWSQEWTIHLIGGRVFNLSVSSASTHVQNLDTVVQLCDYFGIPKKPYDLK